MAPLTAFSTFSPTLFSTACLARSPMLRSIPWPLAFRLTSSKRLVMSKTNLFISNVKIGYTIGTLMQESSQIYGKKRE